MTYKKGRSGEHFRRVKINSNGNKNKKYEYAKLVFLCVFLLTIIFGTSYAFLSQIINSNKKVEVTAGTFVINFKEKNTINLKNAVPMTDQEGMNTDVYSFTVSNTGSLDAKYDISLEENSSNTLDRKYVKYSIREGNGEWSSPVLLSTGLNLKSNRSLKSGATDSYELKIWLDEDAGNDAQGKSYGAKVVVNAVQTNSTITDFTTPIILLNGSSIVKLNQGDTFTDLGVQEVKDDKDDLSISNVEKSYEYFDGGNTVEVSSIDTSKVGIYYIYYKISDSSGNIGVSTRTVIISKKNTDLPTISLVGDEVVTIKEGEKYTESGAIANDENGTNLTDKIVTIGQVNTKIAGVYVIKYLIVDNYSNTASVTRTVIVEPINKDFKVNITSDDSSITEKIVTVDVISDASFVKYAVTDKNKKPSNSKYSELEKTKDGYSTKITFRKNGIYYIWIKDSNGKIASKKIVVDNLDKTKPTCKFKTNGYVGIGSDSKISLICTDVADIESKYLLKSNFEISNSDLIDSFDISSPNKIDNGYEWILTLSAKKMGSFKISLLGDSISDKVDNKNDKVTSDDIKISELVLDNDSSVSLDINGNNMHTIETSGTNIGKLSYSSSDDSIATVSDKGVITGVSPGEAKIIVKENNGGAYRTIKVDVSKTLTAKFVKNGVGVEKISSTEESCKLTKDNKETCNIISAPTISVSNGYEVIGWNVDKTAHDGVMSISLSDNETFYSISKKSDSVFTANFDSNNGSAILSKEGSVSCSIPGVYNDEPQNVTSCDITVPTITGKSPTPIVLGFSTNASSEKAEINSGSTLTLTDKNTNTTWYAITTNEDITYTARFIKNDGNGVVNNSWSNKTCAIEKTYNGLAQATSCTIDEIPTIEVSSGYEAIGWNTDKASHVGLGSLVLSNDTNFYTIVKKLPVTYTATLHKNGNGVTAIGSNSISCTTKESYNGEEESNTCIPSQLPSISVSSGYKALGWSQDSSAKVKASDTMATDGYIEIGGSITLADNINLYSISKKDDVTYSVTFDSNGTILSKEGVLSCTIDGVYNNDTQMDSCSVDVPTITREGFDIIGFSTDSNNTDTDSSAHIKGGSSLELSSSNDKKTYYANTKKDVTVTWNANGATLNTLTTSKTIWNKNSSVVITAPEITRDGYEIIGWSKDPNGNENSKDLVKVGSNITISSNDSYYAITKRVVNTTFYYYNGSKQVSDTASCILYNSSSICDIDIPDSVVDSVGPDSTLYKGVSNKTSSTSIVNKIDGSANYYAVYDNNIDVNFYYYNGDEQDIVSRSGVRSAVSDGTSYKVSNENIKVPDVVSSSVGVDSSSYQGLSISPDSSNKTSSVTTANSNYYAYYKNTWKAKFNNQNGDKATIGSTSESCDSYVTSNGTVYSGTTCQVTLPSISVTNDYKITGWNIDKDATSGTMPGQKVTIGKNTVNATDGITTNYYTILGKGAITRIATFNKNGAASQTDSNNQASTADTVVRSCTIDAISNIASQTQATTCNITTPTIVGSSKTPIVLGYNTTSSATIATVNQNTAISLSSNPTYYAITKKDAVTFTANWNANGATLSSIAQSSCNIAATYNGAEQATSCTVTAPTITAPSATPTVLGYNTSATSNSNNSSYNTTSKLLTLNSSNTGSTWYAQTRKDVVNYTVSSYEKGSNVSSVGAKTDANSKCTIKATYNGTAQATSCTVTAPTITANTGYTSVGWSLTSGATTGSSVITLNSSNTGKAWYANAMANSYTINYYDGTTLKGSSSAKVDTYPTLTKASSLSLSKTGYTFKGWATTNGGAVVYTDGQKLTTNLATIAGAKVNLYAVWKDETAPVCSFSGASATTVQNTTSITLSCTDSGSGVVQKTLATTDFTTTANGSVTAVSAPVKITNGYSYTVTLKGLSVGTFTVSLKAGLISDAAGNTNAAVTSGNVTVNGRTYTVTFSKGSNVSAISSTSSSCTTTGSSLTCTIGTYPTITAATGYSASTWYDSTAKKDTGIASGGSGSGYAIGQNTIMTAQAKANTYTISYNANGGSGTMASTTAAYGSTTTISANTFTKTGYSFAGWTTNSDGSDDGYDWTNWSGIWKYVNGQYGISGGKLVLYARWTVNRYTLTINPNSGTYNGKTSNTTVTQDYDSTYGLTTPTKTGYTFSGWSLNSGAKGTLIRGNSSGMFSSANHLSGTIKTDTDGSQYTNYTMNYKNSAAAGTYIYPYIKFNHYSYISGHKYRVSVMVRVRTLSGFNWINLRHSAFENDWGSTGVVLKSIGVNNNWVEYVMERTFTGTKVTLSGNEKNIDPVFEVYSELNGGKTGIIDMDMKNLTIYDVTAGTYISSSGYSDYIYKYGDSNDTVTANYNINSYTVTYDKNGGDSVSKVSASVNYGSKIDLTPIASKNGYEFIGWNTSASATTALSSLTMETENVTLYAIYKKVVTIPTNSLCTNPTYNGSEQSITSVTSGDGYTLSGYKGTNASDGYTVTASLSGFSKWSDGTTSDKTFTCSIKKAANPISVTASQTWNPTFSSSAQTKAITTASNAQGSVTYSIIKQVNSSGSSVTKFSLSGTTLTMAANTSVDTYTVTIRATAAGNGNYNSGSKDIMMTVTVGKATNPISVTASQTWNTRFSSSTQTKAITTASNAQGSVTYSIIKQVNSSGSSVTNFSLSETILTMAANTSVDTYTVTIRATAAGNGNYNSGSKDIMMTVTVGKATNSISVTASQTWNTRFSSSAQTKAITTASNAQGSVTYSIIKQVNSSGSSVTKFSLSGTTLTMAANTSVDTYTVTIRATAAGNGNYNSGSKDITFKVTVDSTTISIIFDPNENGTNSLKAQSSSTSSGVVAATCTTENGVVKCECVMSNSNGCSVKSPTITAPSNTPIAVGFATSPNAHSSSWNQDTQKTITDTTSVTYYAQTKRDYFAGDFSGVSQPGISSISKTKVSCPTPSVFWNNEQPSGSCFINSPIITVTDGNELTAPKGGWFNSSGTRVADSGGSIKLSADESFTAKASIWAAGVTYSDTYRVGCSTVQCAIDKIYSIVK